MTASSLPTRRSRAVLHEGEEEKDRRWLLLLPLLL
jgi:hypothetical protein